MGEAFGVRCEAVRAQEAPDLMAWDPASRANLGRLRQRGVVAVRYESRGSRGLLVPTEQQWVWAARGNAQRAFPWGEDEDSGRACSDRAKEGTCEVTAHPRGATPEGVVGLVGNVSELVETGVNGTRAMGGDYRKAVKDLRPYSGRSADSAPEIGVRCVTR